MPPRNMAEKMRENPLAIIFAKQRELRGKIGTRVGSAKPGKRIFGDQVTNVAGLVSGERIAR